MLTALLPMNLRIADNTSRSMVNIRHQEPVDRFLLRFSASDRSHESARHDLRHAVARFSDAAKSLGFFLDHIVPRELMEPLYTRWGQQTCETLILEPLDLPMVFSGNWQSANDKLLPIVFKLDEAVAFVREQGVLEKLEKVNPLVKERLAKALDALPATIGDVKRLLSDLDIENPWASLQKETVNLYQLAADLIPQLQRQDYAEGKTVRVIPPAHGHYDAHVDPTRIRQVLTNLVKNGLEHSPIGSHVDISIVDGGDNLEITVSDQGSGIPETIRPRLFQPHATTHWDPVSHGWGLFNCKTLVEAHGGTIGYKTGTQGTTFIVKLPKGL